jgi:hypothetical protein
MRRELARKKLISCVPKPCIAEVGLVEPRTTQSGPAQVRFTEVGASEHGGIELSAADVGFTQASTSQHCVGHQRELHVRLGETGILKAGRNEVCPT